MRTHNRSRAVISSVVHLLWILRYRAAFYRDQANFSAGRYRKLPKAVFESYGTDKRRRAGRAHGEDGEEASAAAGAAAAPASEASAAAAAGAGVHHHHQPPPPAKRTASPAAAAGPCKAGGADAARPPTCPAAHREADVEPGAAAGGVPERPAPAAASAAS